jgi:catechol 2,3-dioxygenase-like lactoylglutathione lyase family enzyme
MIAGLAHVCFTVTNLDAAIRFYCDVLGMRLAFEFRNRENRRFGAYFHGGERTFIEVFEGEHVPAVERASFRHICLEVKDIQAAVAEIRRKDVSVSDPKLGADRSFQAWLSDPDGNRIELHQYTTAGNQNVFLTTGSAPICVL